MYTMQSDDVEVVLWKALSIFCDGIKLLPEENIRNGKRMSTSKEPF